MSNFHLKEEIVEEVEFQSVANLKGSLEVIRVSIGSTYGAERVLHSLWITDGNGSFSESEAYTQEEFIAFLNGMKLMKQFHHLGVNIDHIPEVTRPAR